MRYKVGDKVVPKQGLEAASIWFSDKYVIVSAINVGDYTVKPSQGNDYSWLGEDEIDHDATMAL